MDDVCILRPHSAEDRLRFSLCGDRRRMCLLAIPFLSCAIRAPTRHDAAAPPPALHTATYGHKRPVDHAETVLEQTETACVSIAEH